MTYEVHITNPDGRRECLTQGDTAQEAIREATEWFRARGYDGQTGTECTTAALVDAETGDETQIVLEWDCEELDGDLLDEADFQYNAAIGKIRSF